jgi:hypothetical protein
MKPKQKRIVAVLAAANVIVILGLVLWISRSLSDRSAPLPTTVFQTEVSIETREGTVSSPTLSTSAPTDSRSTDVPLLPTTSSSYGDCQWEAVQLLARAGLDGAVTLTSDGTLRFDITYSLAPGQAVDEAAQSIWSAFDIALALLEEECDFFTQIEVIVLAQGNSTGTHISARVSTADLIAFSAGELSDDEFTERVVYQVSDE